jgi:hypothetical protein
VALVEQVALRDQLERPPDRLDVGGVERAVGGVEVDPEPDALRHRVPVLEVGEDRLAAALVELGDAVGLDLRLRADAQVALDRDLHGQAMAVPAALALHQVPAHGLEAREDVLEDAREDVVGAGPPVGGGRALVEHPRLGALTAAQRLAEDVALAPPAQHLQLELGEGLLGVDRARHRCADSRRGRNRGPSRSLWRQMRVLPWILALVAAGLLPASAARRGRVGGIVVDTGDACSGGSRPSACRRRRRSRGTAGRAVRDADRARRPAGAAAGDSPRTRPGDRDRPCGARRAGLARSRGDRPADTDRLEAARPAGRA